jgi:hypothetical protein
MSEDILVMKRSVIASLVISSIACAGLGSISTSFAQGTPIGGSQSPLPTGGMGQSPLPGGMPTGDQSTPVGTPEATSSPDVIRKSIPNQSPGKTMKKKKTLGTTSPRVP